MRPTHTGRTTYTDTSASRNALSTGYYLVTALHG